VHFILAQKWLCGGHEEAETQEESQKGFKTRQKEMINIY
jgi:hypothetical protein